MTRFDFTALGNSLTALLGATLLSAACLAGALVPARAAEVQIAAAVDCGPIAADRIA